MWIGRQLLTSHPTNPQRTESLSQATAKLQYYLWTLKSLHLVLRDFWCYQCQHKCILFLNSQNGMYQSPPSRQQSINNGSTQPQQLKTQQQQQPPHPNNTPSPRIQHSGVPPNQQLVSCTSRILLVVTLGLLLWMFMQVSRRSSLQCQSLISAGIHASVTFSVPASVSLFSHTPLKHSTQSGFPAHS